MNRAVIFRIALLVFVVAGLGCTKKKPERLVVSTSIFPIYDLARRIAGPDADVHNLVPPGKTPHGFEPSEAARSAIGFAIGLGLDDWMERVVKEKSSTARVVALGDRVPLLMVSSDVADPHVWLDPQRAQLIVRVIAEEMGRADSAHALDYRARATEIDHSLAALDQEAEKRLTALTHRDFVSFHPSFGYFAERYRLRVAGVIEKTAGTPPPADVVSQIRTVLKEKNVPAIFREPQFDGEPAQAIAAEAKIPIGVLDPLGGTAGADSYEGMIRFNVSAFEAHFR